MQLDLSDEEAQALTRLVRRAIDDDATATKKARTSKRGHMPEARVAAPIRAEVPFCLVRDHDNPISHAFEEPYEFGLQDNKGEIVAGNRDPAGRFVFDFSLKVKPAADGRPIFTGRFASGPPDDRFVYLSWRSVPRGVYINRLKARLSSIDWEMIADALDGGRRLCADMTDWQLGDSRRNVHGAWSPVGAAPRPAEGDPG